VQADHVLFPAVENVPEAVGQFVQELLVQLLAGPDRQAFQFLQAQGRRDEAALGSGLDGADQIAAVDRLRFAHVIQQADEIAHRQEAQLFR